MYYKLHIASGLCKEYIPIGEGMGRMLCNVMRTPDMDESLLAYAVSSVDGRE